MIRQHRFSDGLILHHGPRSHRSPESSMSSSTRRSLVAIAIALLPLQRARADGWALLPNGEWGFTQQVSTSGLFTCLNAQYYLAGGSCVASGNSVTLVSGASSMTVTFTGSIQSVLATGIRSGPLVMGTFTKSFSGGPFTIPPMASRFSALFNFRLTLNGSTGTSGSVTSGYTSEAGNSLPYNCCEYPTWTQLGIGAVPPGLTYSSAVFDTFAGRDITFDTSPHTITAAVGLVPEPASVALLMGGLLGVAAVSIARRQRCR
jgi:PEP-CTERM motif